MILLTLPLPPLLLLLPPALLKPLLVAVVLLVAVALLVVLATPCPPPSPPPPPPPLVASSERVSGSRARTSISRPGEVSTIALAGRQSVSRWPRVMSEDHHTSISTSVNNGGTTVALAPAAVAFVVVVVGCVNIHVVGVIVIMPSFSSWARA